MRLLKEKINTICFIYGLIFIIVLIADRLTKWWIMQHQSMKINTMISFSLSYNRGISWSLLSTHNPFLFTGITMIISLFIVYFGWYSFMRFIRGDSIIGNIFIVSGALSNVIDRFLYQGVADFIVVSWNSWQWPSFNVADGAIVIGCLIMLFSINEE